MFKDIVHCLLCSYPLVRRDKVYRVVRVFFHRLQIENQRTLVCV